MKRPGATFLLLACLFGLVFAFFLIREFSFIKEQGIIPGMLTRWHLMRAFLFSLDWAPVFQAAGILIAFGLFKDPDSDGGALSFIKANRGMLSVALLLSVAYAILTVYAAPNARTEIRRLRNASEAFQAELASAKKDINAELWQSAADKLKVLSIIDHNDKRYIDLQSAYERRPNAEAPETQAVPAGKQNAKAQELSANEYYLKALQAQKAGDLYTAHSLATKAYRIDANRTDAQRLAAQLWNDISAMTESPQEKELQQVAKDKNDAYKLLSSGDPVAAYGKFLELKQRAPKDADIDEYLKQSLDESRKISFFKDEITRLSRFPNANGVFFRIKIDAKTEVFVACDTAYFGVEQAYAAGLEYMSVSLGKATLKAVAPYAKLQGNRLLLACYDRENPQEAFLPSFPIKEDKLTFTNYLTVPFGISELKLAAIAAGSPSEASILQLASICRGNKIGVDSRPFIKEALMRIQACLAFFIISLACVYIGFRFRHRGSRKQVAGAIVSFPISVFIAGIALEAWSWFNGTLASILIRTLPAAAITVFILIQAAALILAFVILAGYRDAPSD